MLRFTLKDYILRPGISRLGKIIFVLLLFAMAVVSAIAIAIELTNFEVAETGLGWLVLAPAVCIVLYCCIVNRTVSGKSVLSTESVIWDPEQKIVVLRLPEDKMIWLSCFDPLLKGRKVVTFDSVCFQVPPRTMFLTNFGTTIVKVVPDGGVVLRSDLPGNGSCCVPVSYGSITVTRYTTTDFVRISKHLVIRLHAKIATVQDPGASHRMRLALGGNIDDGLTRWLNSTLSSTASDQPNITTDELRKTMRIAIKNRWSTDVMLLEDGTYTEPIA